MGDASRLVNAMRRAGATNPTQLADMVVGKVTSVSPLKVKTDKLELTETFLVVGALCQETIIKIPEREDNYHVHEVPAHVTDIGGSPPHVHTVSKFNTEQALPDILLWRGLEVGDEVYMIRFSQGQRYYIMQRKEGIT